MQVEFAKALIGASNELTFIATFKQQMKNTGSIFSLSEGNTPLLEIQSSGRKNEVRFTYTERGQVHTEVFPVAVTDEQWHRLALSLSGHTITLYIDCEEVARRVLEGPVEKSYGPDVNLWLGQRSAGESLFKGILQDVKIIAKEHAYLLQCPHANAGCPTCGQFNLMQDRMSALESLVENLTQKIMTLEDHIRDLQRCECNRTCRAEGSQKQHGDIWRPNDCETCACENGTVKCVSESCPPLESICTHECQNGGRCVGPNHCQCQIGWSGPTCAKDIDECEDAQIHRCHNNSVCKNTPGWYDCICRDGFRSRWHSNEYGVLCEDINECVNGLDTCDSSAECVNLEGGYMCQCMDDEDCSRDCVIGNMRHHNGARWRMPELCRTCVCTVSLIPL
ncbi:PREDICTED: protein kinase C-binding protein NELL2-like [Priapulus caudatus]|uniref:Protein kinase C-binding protein NELL2-like n=1 Tax=Priapulus caudatus TaxID=37621 RepID=A0ABM1EFT8_PRICU|nr:PREDICTED: protein kinase C-binding protein NELL2-like [Priapulus caudatus]